MTKRAARKRKAERSGYEPSDAPPKLVVAAIAGCLSLIGIGALTAWAIAAGYLGAHPTRAPTGFDRAAAVPASPRLEIDARAERMALDRQAQAHLAGYGWSNQAARLAHIPIERAMALQAAAGWPDADVNGAAPAPSNAAGAAPSNAAEETP